MLPLAEYPGGRAIYAGEFISSHLQGRSDPFGHLFCSSIDRKAYCASTDKKVDQSVTARLRALRLQCARRPRNDRFFDYHCLLCVASFSPGPRLSK